MKQTISPFLMAAIMVVGPLASPRKTHSQGTGAPTSAPSRAPDDFRWAVRSTIGFNGLPFPQGAEKTECHPLQYFSGNYKTFEYDFDLIGPNPSATKDDVKSQYIGEISGHKVQWVTHEIQYSGEDSNSPTFIKLILVERTPGDYCAILNDQGMKAEILALTPPYFLTVASEKVLASRDPVNGNCGCFREAFRTFDDGGPIYLNLKIVSDTANALVPPGGAFWHGWGFDIKTLSYSYDVTPLRPNGPSGEIWIKFGLRDHQLAVIGKGFDDSVRPGQ